MNELLSSLTIFLSCRFSVKQLLTLFGGEDDYYVRRRKAWVHIYACNLEVLIFPGDWLRYMRMFEFCNVSKLFFQHVKTVKFSPAYRPPFLLSSISNCNLLFHIYILYNLTIILYEFNLGGKQNYYINVIIISDLVLRQCRKGWIITGLNSKKCRPTLYLKMFHWLPGQVFYQYCSVIPKYGIILGRLLSQFPNLVSESR